MSQSNQRPASEWEARKDAIERLYVHEKKNLPHIIKAMQHRGFYATPSQYKRRFKEWKLSKNLTAKEWKRISRMVESRTKDGKLSQVILRGAIVSPERLRKEAGRYHLPTMFCQSPTPEPMEGVVVRTPRAKESDFLQPTDMILSSQRQDLRAGSCYTDYSIQRRSVVVPDDLPSFEFVKALNLQGMTHIRLENALTLTFSKGSKFGDTISQACGSLESNLQLVSEYISACILSLGPHPLSGSLTSRALIRSEPGYEQCLPLEDDRFKLQVELVFKEHVSSLSLRLIKLIVLFCANSISTVHYDEVLDSVEEISSSIDTVMSFLILITNYHLIWIITKLLKITSSATRIFSGKALLCAVEMEDKRLVVAIMKSCPPLDAKKLISWEKLKEIGTVLHLAVLQQNIGLIRSLLALGCDPDGYEKQSDGQSSTPLGMMLQSCSCVFQASLDVIQTLLDAQNSAYSKYRNRLS